MFVKRFLGKSLLNAMIGSVSLPLVFGFLVAGALLVQQGQTLFQSKSLSRQIILVYNFGSLLHEQQKERGATSVFLSSKGSEFGPQLGNQRELTDAALAKLRESLSIIGLESLPSALREQIETVLNDITGRAQVRQSVDALEIATPAALGHYTQSNKDLLKAVKLVGSTSSNPQILIKVMALEALLAAKEFSGIERAIGSGGFAAGQFSTERGLLLESLISRQNLSLDRFSNFASDANLARLTEINALPEVAELKNLREIAFAAMTSKDTKGVTAEQYFQTTTVRIDGFKQMEDDLIAEVKSTARQKYVSALAATLTLAASVVLVLTLSALATRFSVRNMLISVRKISNAGDRLARGEKDVEMPSEIPSELGRIVWSINFFRKSVIESQEREAKIVEERNRADAQKRDLEAARQREENARMQEEAAAAKQEQKQLEEYTEKVAKMVSACATGDFSQRIEIDENGGVLAEIASGLNQISDGVATSLNEIKKALAYLADGDMTYRMTGEHQGVFSDIARAMTEATDKMARTLASVNSAAETVSGSANEIASATDDLARRSEQNAAMLQRTASTIDDMSGSIRQAAEAAISARQHVGEVSTKAKQGSETATDMIEAMQEIQSSSEDIVKILAVIDDIAFQTNLLALNAGVEAARAGDAGRGFAVVASEVRALAQRSSDSGQEIARLISSSSASIERGVDMVDLTAKALNGIALDVQQVSGQMEQIASSLDENRQNIKAVSDATAELDTSTQKNAAMFEETNASVQMLDHEARALTERVSSFDINDVSVSKQDSDTLVAAE